jgi:hypothetical protein
VVNSTTNSTTMGSASTVDAGTGTTGIFAATAGTAYTVTEAASGTANLALYNATISCTDSAGLQTGLPSAAAYNPAVGVSITPVAGAQISCTITNATKAPTIEVIVTINNLGRISRRDQFTAQITRSGTVVSNALGATTQGTGRFDVIPGTTGIFVASSGLSYGITEVMAAGSAAALGDYNYVVSCTNTNTAGTNVSGVNALGSTLTPAYGDVITCTITNRPRIIAGVPT